MSLKIRIAKIEEKNKKEEEEKKNVSWLEKNNKIGWEKAKVYSK